MERRQLKHQPIGNYAWMKVIRRAELPQPTKTIAFVLATYAEKDGSEACVGQERLADEAISDERYARDSLKLLAGLGLIELTRKGRRGGDADAYQLTTPGPGLPAVPMRRDPDGRAIDAEGRPLVGNRPKVASVRARLAALTGTPLPERKMPIAAATGNAVPGAEAPDTAGSGTALPEPTSADAVDTGTPLPVGPVDNPGTDLVDNPEYRHPVAGTADDPAGEYRQRVARVPATGCTSSGNGVPVTNLSQPSPTSSPQAGTSLAPVDNSATEQDHEVEPEPSPPLAVNPADYLVAAEILRSIPDIQPWLDAAVEAILADGAPHVSAQMIACRAAEIYLAAGAPEAQPVPNGTPRP